MVCSKPHLLIPYLKAIVLIVLIITFGTGDIWSVSENDSLVQRIDQVRHERDRLQTEVDQAVARIQALSSGIAQLKKQRESGSSLLASYRLDKLLKESSLLSDRLTDLKDKLEEQNRTLSKLQDQYVRDLESNIRQQRVKLKKEEVSELLNLDSSSSAAIPAEEDRDLNESLQFFIDSRTTLSNLVEKKELLESIQRMLSSKVQTVDRMLLEMDRRRRLRESLSEFIEEVSFFEDEMMIKSKNSVTSTAAKEKRSDTGKTADSTNKPEASPDTPNISPKPGEPGVPNPNAEPGSPANLPGDPLATGNPAGPAVKSSLPSGSNVMTPELPEADLAHGDRTGELSRIHSEFSGGKLLNHPEAEISRLSIEGLKIRRGRFLKQEDLVRRKLDELDRELIRRIKSGE